MGLILLWLLGAPLTLILIRALGIPGAALSWTLRCSADLVLYEWATRRAIGSCDIDLAETARARRLTLLAIGLAATFALIAWADPSSVATALTLVAIGLGGYGILAWTSVLSAEERGAWMAMVPRSRQSA